MFDSAFAVGEYLQFATRRVDQLIIALLCELKSDLSITLAVRDQERNLDTIEHALEGHTRGFRHEIVHVVGAEHPHHVIPVVGHWILTFAFETHLLNLGPVVVGAPYGAAGE